MSLGDLLKTKAAERPQAPALFCLDRQMSYGELDETTDRLAQWFLDQGLKPGDRVAVQWPNTIEAVQFYFGLFKAGLICVPINLRLKPAEISWVLENSGAAMHFSHPKLADAMRAAGVTPRTELPETSPLRGELPKIPRESAAAIVYTSGSTGKPKGAVLAHAALLETADASTRRFVDSLLPRRALSFTPIMHVSGLYVMLGCVALGEACVLLPLFDPAIVLDTIEKFRCNVTLTLPALMQMLIEEQMRKPRDLSSLHLLFAGGDTVPVAMQEKARELFGVTLIEGLAQTETGPTISNTPEQSKTGALGVVQDGVEVRLVDKGGRDVPDDVPGELLVRSPMMFSGYWNNAEATAEAIRDGWFHTGDLVSRDAEGWYWFRGRLKEIIIRGGSNISPQEVEEALYSHPEILEAGVIGLPHDVWGEQVVAVVALKEGASAAEHEIRDHARKHLADYKVPERVHFLPVLPKGPTGKVHRKTLKDKLTETIAPKAHT